jgi:hypothetical protein
VVARDEPAGLRPGEDHHHFLMQRRLIGLRSQQITGPLRDELGDNLGLAHFGIKGDDVPLQGRNLRHLV